MTGRKSNEQMRTEDLMGRLERHYIKPGDDYDGGIFIAETGINGTFGASSRCDALHVGFTSASGRVLTGHEVKVSRSDWLAELRKVGKADTWADECHRWFLVVPTADLVQPGELPPGWGLMVPGSRTRMKVLVPATTYEDRVPGWDAVRSIMARQDTLQRGRLADINREVNAKVAAMVPAQVAQRMSAEGIVRMTPELREQERILARFREVTGVDLKTFTHNEPDELDATPEEYAAALRVVRAASMLGGMHGASARLVQQIEQVSEELTGLVRGLSEFRDGRRR